MAAPTRVQSTGRVRGSLVLSVPLTFLSPPTAGNTIVAAAIVFNSTAAVFTCADNWGNTYLQVGAQANGNLGTVVFACTTPLVTGSPFTVTITGNATVYFEAAAMEITGAGGTGVLTVDRTVGQNGSGTTPSTGTTAALAGTDVFALALTAIQTNQASITVQTVSPPWLEEFENLNYSATVAGELDSRSLTGVLGTTQTCSWTDTVGNQYAALLVVFKGTAAAAVETTRPFVVFPL